MALMPRGQPHSVPDPEGEAYDEWIRNKRAAELAASAPRRNSRGLSPSYRSPGIPSREEIEATQARRVKAGIVRIKGKDYVAIDDGEACRYIPATYVRRSDPAAAQRRARTNERIDYLRKHPIGAALYVGGRMLGLDENAAMAGMLAGGAGDELGDPWKDMKDIPSPTPQRFRSPRTGR